jgi:dipeptidyl aminopeptidase/acylaminoacyl peptidase
MVRCSQALAIPCSATPSVFLSSKLGQPSHADESDTARGGARRLHQGAVAAGFGVLDPNYRGSTGFGVAFREAIRKTGWGGLEQDDIRAGIEAMIARGIAEPGKVGITGTS